MIRQREEREQEPETWKEKRREREREREEMRGSRERKKKIFYEKGIKKILFWFCNLLHQILNVGYYYSKIVNFFTIIMLGNGTFCVLMVKYIYIWHMVVQK